MNQGCPVSLGETIYNAARDIIMSPPHYIHLVEQMQIGIELLGRCEETRVSCLVAAAGDALGTSHWLSKMSIAYSIPTCKNFRLFSRMIK